MATRLRRKLGYEDYARIPADGKRHEILDGELYVTPAPTPLHQRLDPDGESLECLRREGGGCRSIGEARVPETLGHPDWPELRIDLGALWR